MSLVYFYSEQQCAECFSYISYFRHNWGISGHSVLKKTVSPTHCTANQPPLIACCNIQAFTYTIWKREYLMGNTLDWDVTVLNWMISKNMQKICWIASFDVDILKSYFRKHIRKPCTLPETHYLYRKNKRKQDLRFVTTYSNQWSEIWGLLTKKWHILRSDSRLQLFLTTLYALLLLAHIRW